MSGNYTYANCLSCHATNKVMTEKVLKSEAVCGKCKKALTFHKLVSDTDNVGLKKLITQTTLPMVVDFWAPWCGPCRAFAPTFEMASAQLAGGVVFVKVNTETFPSVSSELNIRGIPTLILFNNGKEVKRISGALDLDSLKQWLG